MPIPQSIVHHIGKPDAEQPAALQRAGEACAASPAMADLLASFNDSFHAKPKAWGPFSEEDGSSAFASGLHRYLEGESGFAEFTGEVAEKIKTLVDEHLPLGGRVLFLHYHKETPST